MSRVLVIGCGGVASVAIQKCCQVDEVFTEMCIASRTKEKCDALVEKLKGKTKTVLTTARVDADDADQQSPHPVRVLPLRFRKMPPAYQQNR